MTNLNQRLVMLAAMPVYYLDAITVGMPYKTIIVNNAPYLERYFVAQDDDGRQLWLHHFMTSDGEAHLHTHPWSATSFVLHGGITEQVGRMRGGKLQTWEVYHNVGYSYRIEPATLHRISHVQKTSLGDVWTALIVEPEREDEWYFIDDDLTAVPMKSSGADWWVGAEVKKL